MNTFQTGIRRNESFLPTSRCYSRHSLFESDELWPRICRLAGLEAVKQSLADAEAAVIAKSASLRRTQMRHEAVLGSLEGALVSAVKGALEGVRSDQRQQGNNPF